MESNRGWTEWSQHVLNSLDRLHETQDKMSDKVQELKENMETRFSEAVTSIRGELALIQAKVAQMEASKVVELRVEVDALKKNQEDRETRIRALESSQNKFSGKAAIIGTLGTAIVAALISFLFNLAKPNASHINKKPIPTLVAPTNK